MEITILIISNIINCILIIIAYTIGLINGQKIKKEEKIIMPNPIQVLKEKKIEKELISETKDEQEKINIMLYNIDSYDGTGIGQKEIQRIE